MGSLEPRPGVVTLAVVLLAASTAIADSTRTEAGPPGSPMGDGPGGAAPAAAGSEKRAAVIGRSVLLSRLDPRPFLDEDARAAAAAAGPKAVRVGVVREFGEKRAPRRLRPGAAGVASLEDGGLAWTMEVQSGGARSVRLHVSRCELPPGATLVVYDAADPREAYGPFTGAGPGDRASFWTPTVSGERVRAELRVPPAAAGAPIRFAIDSVVHDYRDPGALPAASPGPKSSGSCEIDVQCDSSFGSNAAHGVARMSFVSGGGSYYCSGSLLNDNDASTSTPWFLTANHCISSEAEANSLDLAWDYYAPFCGGSAPSLSSVPRTLGATLVVTSSTTDVTLLRLTGNVPSGRTMLGWTSSTPSVGTAIYGVHHPSADVMKVSYGSITGLQQSFHDVVWTSGVTEGGSSGSPLLNASQQVLGQLWGGSSSCSFQSGSDSYGRFDVSYSLLKPYIWDITGSGGPPDPGPTPDPVTPPGPGPVGPPPEFFLGLWQKWLLGDGDFHSWRMGILKPTYPPSRTLKLKVEVKGRPGAWAKVTDPAGHVSIHPKGRSYITSIAGGYWPLELHAADGDPAKTLKVRVTKNW